MTNDELRAIAEAATPGPWEEFYDDPERGTWCLIQTDSIGLIREDAPVVASSVEDRDARYIATFDPRRALAALDVIEAARALAEVITARPVAEDSPLARTRDALAHWKAL